ncbi:MAG: CDP-glucose 4,6-dehydratase [Phycisphaerales bacterium]|nr:MAG: CDP-glucose 4,6-dehydratase [Phycisphaerales bacterium]
MFKGTYKGKRVVVTGHTGFKGSWLCLWLLRLGAKITGYSLEPSTEPNHFRRLDLEMNSVMGDVRDAEKLRQVFQKEQPEIVLHLAAQSLVRPSYRDPVETFSTNVMGTISVLEAVRECGAVRAVINVTSDKCYENREWPWGYREIDPVGGYDPYSASKGCAELVTRCWRSSFFNLDDYGRAHNTLLASARAGNVIGGGDWATDRLVPDLVRAANRKVAVTIRNPEAIRPWQHVLEPLSGYLSLGQMLLEGRREFADAWNFGPAEDGNATVREIADRAQRIWPEIKFQIDATAGQLHEAGMLKLDCSKARTRLRWAPVWDGKTAVEKTVLWYRGFYESGAVRSLDDLGSYVAEARRRHLAWTEA